MKLIQCEQGSMEWMVARVGLTTASRFDRIITPKTRKPSGSRPLLRAELLAEWLMGQPLDWGTNAYVERGTDLEAEARNYYALQYDADVQQVGFVLRDDGLVGGSPDGLLGLHGVLEIKCPMAVQHVRYMLGEDPDYIGQVQGYLYLTGRDWCDVLSYNPELPPVVNRVERDEDYIGALVPVLDKFVEQLELDKINLARYRVARPWNEETQSDDTG